MRMVFANLDAISTCRGATTSTFPHFVDTNNNGQRDVVSKKCLFGPSNPEDTTHLLQEQFDFDRKRFMSLYGLDINNLENVPCSKKKPKTKNERTSKEKRILKPYNRQMKITDFCQTKKRIPIAKEEDKEQLEQHLSI